MSNKKLIASGSPGADSKQRKIVVTPGQLRTLALNPLLVDHLFHALESMPGISVANALKFAEYQLTPKVGSH